MMADSCAFLAWTDLDQNETELTVLVSLMQEALKP
jgi:hypothetical protein